MTPLEKREQLIRMFGAYSKRLEAVYDDYYNRLARLGLSEAVLPSVLGAEKASLFSFSPEATSQLDNIFEDFITKQMGVFRAGITDGALLAMEHDSALFEGFSVLGDTALKTIRKSAAESFLRSRLGSSRGLSLSQLVWNYASQAKAEFEVAISNVIADGLKEGTSAEDLGRKVRGELKHPDMMYRRYHEKVVMADGTKKDVAIWRRRVVDEDGRVRFIKAPLEKVGMGHYRSARKNALRLMRTEINASYHNANYERWQQEPFVIGVRIFLSPQHPDYDCCDELQGNYPKDFYWTGWHPQCYSDDTKVLTDSGWKLFADVKDTDLILSLNPENRGLEYVRIVARQKWWKDGEMICFSNRALDCLVTPEHRMVYIGKHDGKIKYCSAQEFSVRKGGFYRGCEYMGKERSVIRIGEKDFDFNLFCEFMGYYLSDGSLIRKSQIVVSQKDGQPYKERIIESVTQMGFMVYSSECHINFYDRAFCAYLRQFGKSGDKYVPKEIKNASQSQINTFLDAFARCDGHIKAPKTFIGNHGNLCVPKHGERTFYTTSARMAGDLCELLLKIGHRPSIREQQPSTTVKKDGTVIKGNSVCYIISDCSSQTATAFSKEWTIYVGYVYDLTLERNHIMYVQRNGKCFWGSNCMCAIAPITLQGEEKKDYYRRVALGEDMSDYVSPNAITDVPKGYKDYVAANAVKIASADKRGKLAWHFEDNREYWEDIVKEALENKQQPTPLTLEHLQEKIDEWAQTNVGRLATYTDEQKQRLLDNIKRIIDENDFGMRIPREDMNGNNVIDAIFDTYFKSQIETGTGKGMVDPGSRIARSNQLFGTDTAKAQPTDYEKYGMLMDRDILKQAQDSNGGQYWSYGDGIEVRFKKDKVTATFTVGDSLCGDYAPTSVDSPGLSSFSSWDLQTFIADSDLFHRMKMPMELSTVRSNASYVELQYHGKLTLDCVESVYIPQNTLRRLKPSTFDKIKKVGCTIYTTDADGKLTTL